MQDAGEIFLNPPLTITEAATPTPATAARPGSSRPQAGSCRAECPCMPEAAVEVGGELAFFDQLLEGGYSASSAVDSRPSALNRSISAQSVPRSRTNPSHPGMVSTTPPASPRTWL